MRRFAEIKDGVVRAIATGPDNWRPEYTKESGLSAAKIPEGETVMEGCLWDGEKFSPAPEVPEPTPTEEELLAAFEAERAFRLAETAQVNDLILESLALGEAIPDSAKKLIQYRRALREMDAQADFDAKNPPWPERPDSVAKTESASS